MSIIKHPAGGLGAMQEGEIRLVNYLEAILPDSYYLIPNLSLSTKSKNGLYRILEYDLIVVAPHGIYNIENKDWGGRLEGDDRFWYVNGKERKCPLITNQWKTGVLASKLKEQNRNWGKAWVDNIVTLSHPHQTKQGLYGDCINSTFLLNEELKNFILSTSIVRKKNEIKSLQLEIVDFLSGAHAGLKKKDKKRVLRYEIIEILDQSTNYVEYLGTPVEVSSIVKYRIREYALGIRNLPRDERIRQERIIKNQFFALNKIRSNPFILNVDFHIDDESHTFYEISEYLDENSLSAELQRRTFTFEEKIKIIENISSAIEAAHGMEIYHREINPENIFITNGYAILGNFGKAYFIDHHHQGFTVMPTMTEDIIGPYHPIELLTKDAYRSSDLYSIGVLVYELFVEKLPINDPIELNRLGGMLPPDRLPTAINPNLPMWLDELCKHTILSDPDQRWDTINELKEFLSKHTRIGQTSPKKEDEQDRSLGAEELGPGSRVDTYTIYEELGKGGFSRVFKVRHNLQGKDYAMKIFNESIDKTTVENEYRALASLEHPNIVKFIWNGSLSNGQFYTLMNFVEGMHVKEYTHGKLTLPLTKVYDLATDILSALVYLQQREKPIFHRDVKPNNILWHKQERFILIDFNVASTTDTDKDYVGTNPYIPPDLALSAMTVNWDESADPFALGIVLYELVCKQYPFRQKAMAPLDGKPKDPREFNPNLSEAFAEFLMKAANPKKEHRFSHAKEMMKALNEIGKERLIREKKSQTLQVDSELLLNVKSQSFVNYINSLFSQSKHGNLGARANMGNKVFDELTYTETLLDRKLVPAVLDGSYKLVIITGNAGDGKTAFISRLEQEADRLKPMPNGNGQEFFIRNIRFQSNYDGAQDENEIGNIEVLNSFFSPFKNVSNFQQANEGRIIAINEGRLVDFLDQSEGYHYLTDVISEYFASDGEYALPDGLMVINLNLRSIVAGDNSILKKQIKQLTNPDLWKDCESCALKDKCFIKYNIDSFNDSAAGEELINRLEWLVRIAVLKREFHVTMRDLRSFLAFLLTRDKNCQEVGQLLEESTPSQYLLHYYFNIGDYYAADDGNNDRLVRLIRDLDVAQMPIPQQDRDLYFAKHKSEHFIEFQEREYDLLEMFNDGKKMLPVYKQDERYVKETKELLRLFARHQYFEGNIKYKKRLVYQSVLEYVNLLQHPSEEKNSKALRGVSSALALNEGWKNHSLLNEYLILSSSYVQDPYGFSFRLFSLEDFELKVNDLNSLAQYVEYEPDRLTILHKNFPHIHLDVSLDLYELLFFTRLGYTPSINDLKGRFIELEIFKNLLGNLRYDEVILTRDHREFYKIQKTEDLKLVLEKTQW